MLLLLLLHGVARAGFPRKQAPPRWQQHAGKGGGAHSRDGGGREKQKRAVAGSSFLAAAARPLLAGDRDVCLSVPNGFCFLAARSDSRPAAMATATALRTFAQMISRSRQSPPWPRIRISSFEGLKGAGAKQQAGAAEEERSPPSAPPAAAAAAVVQEAFQLDGGGSGEESGAPPSESPLELPLLLLLLCPPSQPAARLPARPSGESAPSQGALRRAALPPGGSLRTLGAGPRSELLPGGRASKGGALATGQRATARPGGGVGAPGKRERGCAALLPFRPAARQLPYPLLLQ